MKNCMIIVFLLANMIFCLTICHSSMGETYLLKSPNSLEFQLSSLDQYWYSSPSYTVDPDSFWIPFYSSTDVPGSIPYRGYISDTRSWFIDFGAFDWFSTWATEHWGYSIPTGEANFSQLTTLSQRQALMQHYFTGMLSLLQSSSINFVSEFEPPFRAWIPLIVLDQLTANGYANSNLSTWFVEPSVIEESMSKYFPLVEWNTDLFWYDYDNGTALAQLLEDNRYGNKIYVQDAFISSLDDIIHNIIVNCVPIGTDVVFPAVLFTMFNSTLYYPGFGAIGGLGHIGSQYPEISYWCLNGRDQLDYFFGGNPDQHRVGLTDTVIHELGHCVGLPHPHDAWGSMPYSPWIFDAATPSLMTYYSQTLEFDQLETDSIMYGYSLQLWGRYMDDISLFLNNPAHTTVQEATLNSLKNQLATIPGLLVMGDYATLRNLFMSVNIQLNQISIELNQVRKNSNFSTQSPLANVSIDFIVGQGIPDGIEIAKNLKTTLDDSYTMTLTPRTTLPTASVNIESRVIKTSAAYDFQLRQQAIRMLTAANTSNFVPDQIPPNAWENYPLNQIFQEISGCAIDGKAFEHWLDQNPASPDAKSSNTLHYRFYLFDLAGITGEDLAVPSSTSLPQTTSSFVIPSILICGVVLAYTRRQRR